MLISEITEFEYKGKVYQTWYKVFGDLKGGKRPLVALHGGPGLTHHYLLSHKLLSEKHGIPVILYDQIGNGQSSHALEEPKEFWIFEVFMDQLDGLLRHLGINSDFDLLGSSWGGMLASTYASSRTPSGLKHLILCNSVADMVKFSEGANKLLQKNFPEIESRMTELYETGQLESEEYMSGAIQFYKKHFCTLDPWPAELTESMMASRTNRNVNVTMMGSILHPTGSLKHWSIGNELREIRAPVLLITSPNDVAQEEAFMPYFLNMPKVKWVEIPTTTHMPMLEDPERYFAVLYAFLEG